ncbi:MAG: sigma-54-dependent Fis family transcriptional regulator [Lentisphaerae bacterium]|nr:sigma-54-dependent Fis family transcriptional regulator [Lentisphaerota bacterium]MCP4102250.1 sigma-54-dependent Fis family transcriptional regulator [Lentisphaerota bacterium]
MSDNGYPETPILLVDDEKNALRSYELALQSAGVSNILKCGDGFEAMEVLKEQDVELVVLDMIMPGMNGSDLLQRITRDYPEVPVIMATCINSLDNAVECMRQGAVDYLVKPVDMDKLISQVKNFIQLRELKRENQFLRSCLLLDKDLKRPEAFAPIITDNKYMLSIFQYCISVSRSSQPVLITGETGVGKELFAKALHQLSGCEGEMVTVNIAGLDDNMLSDALFGHTKGAFTGAGGSRPGIIEKASNGTLFIDEIGDLNMASQVKLLRLLQQREYTPLGSDEIKKSTARVILATHRDLHELQRDNKFRKDLYYRISTHHISIPPLRERKDDIPLLLDHLIGQIAEELEKNPPQYPNELITLLKSYHFPGNIRELEAMVYDAISNHQSRMLSTKVFSDHIARNSRDQGITTSKMRNLEQCISNIEILPTLRNASKVLVIEAMKRSDKNQSVAARMLGVTPQALSSRLKKMDKESL